MTPCKIVKQVEARADHGSAAMLGAAPRAAKYLNFPVLLVVSMRKE